MLAIELFTDADHRRLNKWMRGYQLIDDRGVTRYDGSFGTPPDLLQRIGWLRAQGRQWFRNVVLAAGRRSGKSLLSSILTSSTVWKVLEVDDPQAARAASGQADHVADVSTTREAATRDVFADAAARISRSACFAPFIDQTHPTRSGCSRGRSCAPGPPNVANAARLC